MKYPTCSICGAQHPRDTACDPPDVYADETGTSEYKIWLQQED